MSSGLSYGFVCPYIKDSFIESVVETQQLSFEIVSERNVSMLHVRVNAGVKEPRNFRTNFTFDTCIAVLEKEVDGVARSANGTIYLGKLVDHLVLK